LLYTKFTDINSSQAYTDSTMTSVPTLLLPLDLQLEIIHIVTKMANYTHLDMCTSDSPTKETKE